MIESTQMQRPKLVLVVDDQEINRDSLGIILEDDYEILYAENGKEAVEPMFVDGLPMLRHVLSASSVGSTALNDGAVHLVDEVTDECGFQVVVATALARADFHAHTSVFLHTECVIDFH